MMQVYSIESLVNNPGVNLSEFMQSFLQPDTAVNALPLYMLLTLGSDALIIASVF